MTGADNVALSLQDLAGPAFAGAALVLARISAMMLAAPGFAQGFVPPRLRLAAGLAIASIVFPLVASDLDVPGTLAALLAAIVVEAAVGAAIGLVFRLFTIALEMAGTIAAQATSLAQMFGGDQGEPMPAISHLYLIGGLALAAMGGLHLRLIEAMVLSYDAIPAGVLPGSAILADWSLAHVIQAFALAFGLAAPFLIMATLYNLTLGAINRAMPQLMVTLLGAPAAAAATFALLVMALPGGLLLWRDHVWKGLAMPFGALP
jgi:flagellar biosynthetic protein FliR